MDLRAGVELDLEKKIPNNLAIKSLLMVNRLSDNDPLNFNYARQLYEHDNDEVIAWLSAIRQEYCSQKSMQRLPEINHYSDFLEQGKRFMKEKWDNVSSPFNTVAIKICQTLIGGTLGNFKKLPKIKWWPDQ